VLVTLPGPGPRDARYRYGEVHSDVDGIEARFSDRHIAMSVFSFDDDMIFTPHLTNLAGHESPAFHYRRSQKDGIFDRFMMHVNVLWDEGRDVSAEPAKLG
jgi:hypothetical protein